VALKTETVAKLALAALTVVEAATHTGEIYPDSVGYIQAAYYFEGKISKTDMGAAYFRLLRPVLPFAASLINHIIGINASFSVINFILWCASSLLIFKLTKLLTERTDAALISTAFFNASIPMLFYGGAILTDMAGYFFVLLGTFLTFKIDLPRASYSRVAASALIITLGILARELVGAVILTVLIWTLLTKGSWRRVALLVLIVLAGALLWSTVIGISYSSWFMFNVQRESELAPFISQNAPMSLRIWTWIRTVRIAFRPEIVLATALGAVGILWKNYANLRIQRKLASFVASLLGPAIFTLALAIAGAGTDFRYTFIMFPGVLPLAAIGILWVSGELAHLFTGQSGRCEKLAALFSLLVVLAFVVETNLILLRFISFPWHPYVAV